MTKAKDIEMSEKDKLRARWKTIAYDVENIMKIKK